MLSTLLLTTSLAASGSLAPMQLRCESLTNPIGIGTSVPRLSWKLEPVQKGSYNLSQSGYRIVVGSTPGKTDLWDTGRMRSGETFGIKYSGKALKSGQEAWWRVQVFDQNGKPSPWSTPAKWSVGLLKPSDWKAVWVGYDAPLQMKTTHDPFDGASWIWTNSGDTAYFQRTFNLKPGFTRATIRMTVDDQFALIVNGKEVGASDGKTDAWRRPPGARYH